MSTDSVKPSTAPALKTTATAKNIPKKSHKPSQEEHDLVILHKANSPKLSDRTKVYSITKWLIHSPNFAGSNRSHSSSSLVLFTSNLKFHFVCLPPNKHGNIF